MEQTWDIKPGLQSPESTLGPRILWLQRGGYINDQNFASYCIFGHGARDSIMTSWRRDVFEEHSTLLMRFYSLLLRLLNRNWEGPNTSAGSEKYLEFLVLTGTITSIAGFIIQFIGIRSMNWTVSVAQLTATLIMIVVRAWVRLGIANPPPTQRIPEGHELDWLATRIGDDPELLWAPLGTPKAGYQQESPSGILDEKCWNWSVVTGVGRDKFASVATSQLDSGPNDVVRIRKRLGELSNWAGPVSRFAISASKSIEAVMNTIFTQKEYPKLKILTWSVYGHRGGSKLGKINLNVRRGEDKRWVACAAEVEAVLSLWLYSTKENNKITTPNLTLSDGDTGVDWLRHGQAAVQRRTIRLLGGNEECYCRELHWYLGEGVSTISQVQVDESPISETKDPASPTNNIVEIETRNIVGFTNLGLETAPNRRQFTRFKTQGIRLRSAPDQNETIPNSPNGSARIERYDSLAVISDTQLELLLAQDLFSSFMWGVADEMQTLSVESTVHQTDQKQATDSAWLDSVRLENTDLSSMAREIERAGLGGLDDVYASIIPPLSIRKKLPIPRCLIAHAWDRAQNRAAHGDWKGATDVYSELFGICIAFGRTSPLAVGATSTVYEGLRALRVVKSLLERWQPNPIEIEKLETQELALEKVLSTADKQVVRNLSTMHRIQDSRSKMAFTSSRSDDDITGFSPSDKDCLHITPLHFAVIAGKEDEVRDCLNGANVDAKDVLGWTPLHYAAARGPPEIARLLLSTPARADPNIKDLAGRTALHYAARNGHQEIVQLLREGGAHPGEKDNQGSTPLHLAAQSGHADATKALLAGGGVDKEPIDKFGYRPLHSAAKEGHLEVARLLLEMNVDEESEARGRLRPLHLASYYGHQEVVQLLLERGANKEAESDFSRRPLHHVVRNDDRCFGVAQLLLENCADIEAEDNNGDRPLHIAASKGILKLVQFFLQQRANKEAENNFGRRPLHYAVDNGHLEVARLLLESGADDEAQDNNGSRPLHIAANKGFSELVPLLLKNEDSTEAQDNNGDRPLHIAANEGRLETVRLLLDNGADREGEGAHGGTPLHSAAGRGHLGVVQLLLERGANEEAEDSDGDKPLYIAAGQGHLEVVRILLDRSADKDAKSNGGGKLVKPLHIAVSEGHLEVVRLLLQSGADKEARDTKGGRPLHYAAFQGHLDVARLLLEEGADEGAADSDGDRPLNIAANEGCLELVQLLLENGADNGGKGAHNGTPLHSAAGRGHLDVVRLLLERGANKEAGDNDGDRPLYYAAGQGHAGVVQLLLEEGADIEVKNNDGNRPLHIAVAEGHVDVVRLLLQKGADKEAKDNDGDGPLHIARIREHLGIADLLLDHGADNRAKNAKGRKPGEILQLVRRYR